MRYCCYFGFGMWFKVGNANDILLVFCVGHVAHGR